MKRNEPQPLRTILFVPGNKEDWMRKAVKYGADALVFDLEDAVPEAHRPQAREMVRRVTEELAAQGYTIFVRVNGIDTFETGDDLEAAVCEGLHGIFLPKTRGPEDIVAAATLLEHFEHRAGLPVGRTLINPLLETAQSIRLAYEIGTTSPRVAYMGYGSAKDGDGARAIGYTWTPEGAESLHIRGSVLVDARAANVVYPITGLWPHVGEHDGLRAMAVESKNLGYDGMMCIHPSHVPIINEVFSPTGEEIEEWKGVIAALAEAEAAGTTAIQRDGFLIDTAMVRVAKERLEHAKKLGLA